eukprot:2323133-Rhodomonas_salina.1
MQMRLHAPVPARGPSVTCACLHHSAGNGNWGTNLTPGPVVGFPSRRQVGLLRSYFSYSARNSPSPVPAGLATSALPFQVQHCRSKLGGPTESWCLV